MDYRCTVRMVRCAIVPLLVPSCRLFVLMVVCFLPGVYTSSEQTTSFSNANPACPCINSTRIVAPLSNCRFVPDSNNNSDKQEGSNNSTDSEQVQDEPGILIGSVCVPVDYGANVCDAYDLRFNPACVASASVSKSPPPAYCFNRFCYVDPNQCHEAKELYYLSTAFQTNNPELYYSYSTCNSSAEEWRDYETTNVFQTLYKNKTLKVSLPRMWWPGHYKADENGNIYEDDGPEELDDSIPWIGGVIDYFNALAEISNMPKIHYMRRSNGSRRSGYASEFTQAITDVKAGIVDISISSFWVTSSRLSIAPFTVPVASDPLRLWIQQPQIDDGNFGDNARKVLEPFSTTLWLAIFACILAYALLSAYIAPEKIVNNDNDSVEDKNNTETASTKPKASILLLESMNRSMLNFMGGALGHDPTNSPSHKVLDFGFAIFIFIAVTAYTANLAAFLTLSGTTAFIGSIDDAIASKVRICAFTSTKSELQGLYENANWLFVGDDLDALSAFDRGECSVLVVGWIDHLANPHRQQRFCDRNLVQVGPVIAETPIGFAANQNIVAGVSYWISEAQKQGITFESFLAPDDLVCNTEITLPSADTDELVELTPINMILPLTVFAICCVVALVTSIHQKGATREKKKKLHKATQRSSTKSTCNDDNCAVYEEDEETPSATFTFPTTTNRFQSVANIVQTIENLGQFQQKLALHAKNLLKDDERKRSELQRKNV